MADQTTVGFVVLAGKYESEENGKISKNYKVITAPASMEVALKEMETCKDYDFIDVEYNHPNGNTYEVEMRLKC